MTKKVQNIWRKEMLALMNEDADWYRNEDTERFKRIQELAKKIETASTRQFSSHISKERFEAYQKMGLQFKEILSLDPLEKTLLCLHVHFPPIGFMVNILVLLDPFVC